MRDQQHLAYTQASYGRSAIRGEGLDPSQGEMDRARPVVYYTDRTR